MKHFNTTRKEGVKQRIRRFVYNRVPAIRGTGAFVTFISDDWFEIHLKLPLSWRTRNIVGTVFGGSIYASVDPFYMIQLMRILGDDYVVWDKAATIKFIKPIKKTVYTQFLITEATIQTIKQTVNEKGTLDIDLPVQYTDKSGVVYASISKKIYIASKAHYKQKIHSK